MTTINNLSIEQMREIVDGAPGRAEVCIPCLEDVMYFAKRDDGKWFKWSYGYNQWLEYFGKVDPMDLALDLNDLRTAIAEHDREFKVGDSIVANDESLKKVFVILAIEYGTLYKVAKASFFEIGSFRHATIEEIEAGHRLEAERHG
ncbi:hypothetical protein [Acinetobacter bereziniae]|uniref:hypothetical protein n=1 Tax=Acinetobacter bereziniae TaxID=106648 RepID=UPI0015DAA849|nr:hypothetical protein [Acinetobacter bereziniae]